jgi:hypothetical protein
MMHCATAPRPIRLAKARAARTRTREVDGGDSYIAQVRALGLRARHVVAAAVFALTARRYGRSSTPALLLRANHAATRLADRDDRRGARPRGDAAGSGLARGGGVGAALLARSLIAR